MSFDLRNLTVLSLVFAALLFSSCEAPQDTNTVNARSTPSMTEFERDLKSFKTAGFDYIFVLKRKDGGKMTAEDKQFIRDRRHYATNRSKVSDDETTVFVGSNFAFQDFSKPADQIGKKKEREDNKSGKAAESGSDGNGNSK
jgi:hypothetical protein